MSIPIVRLKPGREKSLLRWHPWVFSGAVAAVQGSPGLGETVAIQADDGRPCGWGAYSPASQIRVRVWSRDPETAITGEWLREQLQQSIQRRETLHHQPDLTLFRLVNAEGDGLPGVVVDRYGEWLVCQFLSAGAERWKSEIVAALASLYPCRGIYERSDGEVRQKEGLPSQTGSLWGDDPPAEIETLEYGLGFGVDVRQGHKTGFYLDQRQNRRFLSTLSAGRDVLNCFAYTGGFAVWAARGGATSITNVDSSASALAGAAANQARLGSPVPVEQIQGDVFQVLRQYRQQGRQFDLIVLDPPKFAENQGQVERACRGYKDINWLALRLLRTGGLLVTFSCSGLVSADLFQKVVAGASLDAQRQADILYRLTQAEDHAVPLHFPEGSYLKGLVCQVH
ncbi:MAG: class I SAM-dependent methyltransferase [Synechococcales cyanobacterium]